jgi:hypothetical protein
VSSEREREPGVIELSGAEVPWHMETRKVMPPYLLAPLASLLQCLCLCRKVMGRTIRLA